MVNDPAASGERARSEEQPTFGARFLDEYKRLGGSLVPLDYATLRELRGSDREGLIRVLRAAQPLSTTYATIQRIRGVESPRRWRWT